MQQLPLDISPATQPSFENFVAGANAEALARVRALAEGSLREAVVYLWGEPGSGRSHLLGAAQRASPNLVVLDDVESLDARGQQDLFAAINAARDGGAGVLAAGAAPPPQLPLREDLRTRLAWGLVYHLKPLAEAEKIEHLQREAARRGLELDDEVTAWLLARLPRDLGSLVRALEALDRHALARKRPLTLALVREVLAASNEGAQLSRQSPAG